MDWRPWAVAGGLILMAGAIKMRETRGWKNNNPFDIEYRPENDWVGQIGSDGRFAIFDTPAHGIRAGAIDLRTKMGRGLDTIRKIITEFAPPSENNTDAYIASVSSRTDIGPDATVTEKNIPAISAAIIAVEQGGRNPQNYAQVFEQGMQLAGYSAGGVALA